MFNVTVIKMKDIKKFLIGMAITAFVIIIGSNYYSKIAEKSKKMQKSFLQNSMVECLETTVPSVGMENKEKESIQNEINKLEENNTWEGILNTQISSIKTIEKIQENSSKNNENQDIKATEAKKEETAEKPKEKVENKDEKNSRRKVARFCYCNSSNNQ